MKYTTEVIIELSRSQVIELFDSTENMYKWQPGLKSVEVISGDPGQEGCRSHMVYEGRKGDLTMAETITRRSFPGEFHSIYESKGVYNEMYNYFTELDDSRTMWKTITIFRFGGLMTIMAPFMRSAFKNNTQLNMERFKVFAENSETSLN